MRYTIRCSQSIKHETQSCKNTAPQYFEKNKYAPLLPSWTRKEESRVVKTEEPGQWELVSGCTVSEGTCASPVFHWQVLRSVGKRETNKKQASMDLFGLTRTLLLYPGAQLRRKRRKRRRSRTGSQTVCPATATQQSIAPLPTSRTRTRSQPPGACTNQSYSQLSCHITARLTTEGSVVGQPEPQAELSGRR